jgi:hypothetical protein
MSWLETAAIVGDVAGPEILGAGADLALTDAILPSTIEGLGSEFGTDAAFNAAGTGANSAIAAGTTSGGIGAGAGSNAAAAAQQTTASGLTGSGLTMPSSAGVGGAGSTSYVPSANALGAGSASSPSYLQSVMGAGNPYAVGASGASAGLGGGSALGSGEAAAPSGVMGYFNSAMDSMAAHPYATAIGGGIAASKMGLFNRPATSPIDTTYRGPLNDIRYNPSVFKPGGGANPSAITQTPYRNYQTNPYTAASGGVMSMASGGIASYSSGNLATTNDFLNMASTGNMSSGSSGHHTDGLMNELSQYASLGANPLPTSSEMPSGMGQGIVGNDDPALRGKNAYQRAQYMNSQLAGITGMQGIPQYNANALGAINTAPPQPIQSAAAGGAMRYAAGGAPDNASDMAINQMFGLNNNAINPKTGVPYSQTQQTQQSGPSGGVLGGALNGIGQGITNIGQGISDGVSSIGRGLGFAQGGVSGGFNLGSYSDGGRLLKGPGDGMSDNIPATIAHKQPARLADGEFVVPADVVSHLGNGSTDAGAKRLYAMMDKVRQARTGSKKQGKEIKADRFVPT